MRKDAITMSDLGAALINMALADDKKIKAMFRFEDGWVELRWDEIHVCGLLIAFHIDEFYLHKTCSACPEQYDVFLETDFNKAFDEKTNKWNPSSEVGYLRLRHGTFRADYIDQEIKKINSRLPDGNKAKDDPKWWSKTVYTAETKGDGTFDTAYERKEHIMKALQEIREEIEKRRERLRRLLNSLIRRA